MSGKQRSAFTLVELLVVVAVISILISLLLPALQRARYSARTAACASNLKMVGVGVSAYTQDNDQFYPSGQICDAKPGCYRNQTAVTCVQETCVGGAGSAADHFSGQPCGKVGNMVKVLQDYFDGLDTMRRAFMCAHGDADWKKTATPTTGLWGSTNSGVQAYSLLWGMRSGGTGGGVWEQRTGMYRVGERWQQGQRFTQYNNKWFNVVAGDFASYAMVASSGNAGSAANHPPLGYSSMFRGMPNAGVKAYFFLPTIMTAEGNFLNNSGAVKYQNYLHNLNPKIGGTGTYLIPADEATQ